ncbi:MAG: phosphodiester glycosidase family protein [Clostridiales bacterium]|nr:phosphodiester glycosidase family protein [Clostridiales bacterium]MDD7309956.1 phosphodiester glycosidase family protein [Eubacteriales bacterium]MDY5346263.1 phosphodiester glycosidase family protein [Eubacteriales bacterium]
MEKRRKKFRIKAIFKYIGLTLASFITLIVVALFVLLYGPFHQLRDLYVITMLETSAAKFMATWFLSDAKIAEILENNRLEVVDEPSDPSLVSIVVPAKTDKPDEPPVETTLPEPAVSTATDSPSESSDTPAQTTEPPVTTPATTTSVTTLNPLQTDAPAPDELFADHPDAMHETDGLDGLQLVKVSGKTFTGYMLVISDPSRVSLCVSYSILHGYQKGWDATYGEQLRSMVKRNGAVAAINGGAFYDPNGKGNGGRPDGALCVEGDLIYWGPEIESAEAYEAEKERIRQAVEAGEIAPDSPEAQIPEMRDWQNDKVNIIGINQDHILILGRFTKAEFLEQGFRDAVSFDNPNPPFLVINGKASTVVGTGGSGIQPRTCIGQRADGAFLFLVIDGRGAGGSLGATQKEAMNLMIEFGAVNAANLDGGSSSELIINGETVSNPCSFYGPRYMPDGFMVR